MKAAPISTSPLNASPLNATATVTAPELLTPRLRLRAAHDGDVPDLIPLGLDPQARAHLGGFRGPGPCEEPRRKAGGVRRGSRGRHAARSP
ncbi:hypothetical protein [Streptomyces virginiae]|uniref:hypothetical protein n=1 Tax=Streptomyces virginiae TaxID=1961 RepID=UPI00365B1987